MRLCVGPELVASDGMKDSHLRNAEQPAGCRHVAPGTRERLDQHPALEAGLRLAPVRDGVGDDRETWMSRACGAYSAAPARRAAKGCSVLGHRGGSLAAPDCLHKQ